MAKITIDPSRVTRVEVRQIGVCGDRCLRLTTSEGKVFIDVDLPCGREPENTLEAIEAAVAGEPLEYDSDILREYPYQRLYPRPIEVFPASMTAEEIWTEAYA